MKLPAKIKKAIRDCAKHNAIANKANNEIRDYIDKILGGEYTGEVGHDYFLDQLIDGTEIGNDPEGVIKFFELHLEREE